MRTGISALKQEFCLVYNFRGTGTGIRYASYIIPLSVKRLEIWPKSVFNVYYSDIWTFGPEISPVDQTL